MAIPARVKKYLEASGVAYEIISHKKVFTAYDAAATLKRELKDIAKSLLVQIDKRLALVLVPADKKIDLAKITKKFQAKKVSIAREAVMSKLLKIKPGALSAFAKLHKIELVIDKSLLKSKKVVLSSGSYTESIIMKVADFVKLEAPQVAVVAMAGGYKLAVHKPKSKKKPAKSKSKARTKKLVKRPIAKKRVARKVVKK
jgi:Ala-tRNA(Pro) deacylase